MVAGVWSRLETCWLILQLCGKFSNGRSFGSKSAPFFQWPRHFNETERSVEVCGTRGTPGPSGSLTRPCQVILTSPCEDRSDRRRRGSTREQGNDGAPQRVPEREWEFFWRPELHVAFPEPKERRWPLSSQQGARESDGCTSPPPAGSGATAEPGGGVGWVHLLVLPNSCRCASETCSRNRKRC